MGTTTLVHMSDLHIAATADDLYMEQGTTANPPRRLDRASAPVSCLAAR